MIMKSENGKFFIFMALSTAFHIAILSGISQNDVNSVKNTYFALEIRHTKKIENSNTTAQLDEGKTAKKITKVDEKNRLKKESKNKYIQKKDVENLHKNSELKKLESQKSIENQRDIEDSSFMFESRDKEIVDFDEMNETISLKGYSDSVPSNRGEDLNVKEEKTSDKISEIKEYSQIDLSKNGAHQNVEGEKTPDKISDFDLDYYKEYVRDYLQKCIKYPYIAIRRNIEGTLLVEILVGVEGKVLDCKIIKSSGSSILDKNALETVKGVVFPKKPEDKVTLQFNLVYKLN